MFAPLSLSLPFPGTSWMMPRVLFPLCLQWRRRWRLVPRWLPLEMSIIVAWLIIHTTTALPPCSAASHWSRLCRCRFVVIIRPTICRRLLMRGKGCLWWGRELSLLANFFSWEAYAREDTELMFAFCSGSCCGSFGGRFRSGSGRRLWMVVVVVAVTLLVMVAVTVVAIIVTIMMVLGFSLGWAWWRVNLACWPVWRSLGSVTVVVSAWWRGNRLLHQHNRGHVSDQNTTIALLPFRFFFTRVPSATGKYQQNGQQLNNNI